MRTHFPKYQYLKKPHTFDCKFASRLDSLQSKLEQSVDAFITARKELEEIFAAEGSSELGRFITESSTDLMTELKSHRELTFRDESSLEENKDPRITVEVPSLAPPAPPPCRGS